VDLLAAGLASAEEAVFTQAFKLTLSRLDDARLLTVAEWRKPSFAPVRVGVLAHVVFARRVRLSNQFGDRTVADLINHGIIFVEAVGSDGECVLLLPYAYLSVLWRESALPADLANMHLLKTPTRTLSPDQNECQDAENLLFRFDLYRSVGQQHVRVAEWLGLEAAGGGAAGDNAAVSLGGDLLIVVPDTATLSFQRAEGWVTFKKAELLPPLGGCVINAKGAPAPDAFVCVAVDTSSSPLLLPALRRRVALPENKIGVAVAKKLKETAFFKDVDWHAGDAASVAAAPGGDASPYLYIMIQSKRRAIVGALTVADVWVEYCKAREFAPAVPFLLVVVTDKDAPPVPVELQHCVAIVGDGEMERFFGPIVAQRRRTSG
jgi:hypothetical protein